MAGQEIYVDVPGSQYGEVLLIEEYKGTWSLVAARRAEDGKIWKRWCYPEKNVDGGKQAGDRPLPWKLELGSSKAQALDTLRKLAGPLMESQG